MFYWFASLVWVGDNNLVGSLPSEIGNLLFMESLDVSQNSLTGHIPHELANDVSLDHIFMEENRFSGTIPDIFGNLPKLNWIVLAMNRLSGTIPDSFWNVNHTFEIPLFGNDLTGTVPDNLCAQVEVLTVDDSSWFIDEPKVSCDCCSEMNCHIWDESLSAVGGTVRPACPKPNIQKLKFFEDYWLVDEVTNLTLYDFAGFLDTFEVDICLSPTGCYKFFDEIESPFTSKFYYSASSKSLTEQETCDAVEICGQTFDQTHPKRIGLNHLTQIAIPNIRDFDDESPEHRALCWVLTEDQMYDEFSICDGTLLQRFVLAMFLISLEKNQISSDEFDERASKVTCEWNHVICDSNMKYVEVLDYSNFVLEGELFTQIGFLTRLQRIDFSKNKLFGSFPHEMFANLPSLETIDVRGNELSGELPLDLFNLANMIEIDISNNLFVGSLPGNVKYSQNLREYSDLCLFFHSHVLCSIRDSLLIAHYCGFV